MGESLMQSCQYKTTAVSKVFVLFITSDTYSNILHLSQFSNSRKKLSWPTLISNYLYLAKCFLSHNLCSLLCFTEWQRILMQSFTEELFLSWRFWRGERSYVTQQKQWDSYFSFFPGELSFEVCGSHVWSLKRFAAETCRQNFFCKPKTEFYWYHIYFKRIWLSWQYIVVTDWSWLIFIRLISVSDEKADHCRQLTLACLCSICKHWKSKDLDIMKG